MPKYHLEENTTFKDYQHSHYIHIDEGEFSRTCFNFGKIEFLGEDDEGNGHIRFDYDLLFLPSDITLQDDGVKERLEEVISLIINEILLNTLEKYETGNTDSDEPAV